MRLLRASLAAALFAAMLQAPGLAREEDQVALRQLENGDRLARDGKVEQAESAWRDVATRYPDSVAAPAALDRLGSVAYPVEDFAGRGRADSTEVASARAFFERIAADYRTSPQAPRAIYKLGLLFSDPASPFYNLDEAYARFSTVVNVYPQSDVVDDALLGMGMTLDIQENGLQPLVPLSRLLTDRPDSDLADRALFLSGIRLARAGRLEDAALEFQRLRDDTPDSPLAAEARDRATHLVRLISAGGPTAVSPYGHAHVISLGLPPASTPREVAGMAVDRGGHIYLVDGRGGSVLTLDEAGGLVARATVSKPGAIWIDDAGTLIAAEGEIVREGHRTLLPPPAGGEPLGAIDFVSRDPQGRIVVRDRRTGNLVRYRRNATFESVLLSGRERRTDAIAAGTDGTLYLLDARTRSVTVRAPGNPERRVPIGLVDVLRHPDGLAVDFVGNLFVLDRAARAIGVFDSEGKALARVVTDKGAAAVEFEPLAFAINPRGEVVIFDERRHAIVVLR